MVDCIAQKNIDYKFTKGFLWLINLDLILNNIFAFCNAAVFTTDKSGGWDYLFNYISIVDFLYVILFCLFKKKINVNMISGLFIFFLMVGGLIGLAKGQYNIKFLSHIYEFIMPVLMISIAKVVVKEVSAHPEFAKQVNRIAVLNTWIYIFFVILFRICHSLDLVYYPAYGSGTPDFTLPYLFFAMSNPMLAYAGTVACLLSGKRAIILKACLVVIVYFFLKKKSKKQIIIDFLVLAGSVAICLVLSQETNWLDRISFTIEKTFGENANLDQASSGRAREIVTIVSMLDQSTINWILGCGFGILVPIPNAVVRSYSHFTPLAYTMICGSIFTIFLYGWMMFNMCKCFFKKSSFYRMCGTYLLIIIVGSMMGAGLLNIAKYWMVLGVVMATLENKKDFNNHRFRERLNVC